MLTSELFDRDISSLHKLRLQSIYTELPWKNMANLTTLWLFDITPVSMRQLLDFLENSPHLREVHLRFETPTIAAPNRRLVSLTHLKNMDIEGGPASILLNHLMIPVGAYLAAEVDLPSPPIGYYHLTFLNNLKNLSNFTTIRLTGWLHPRIEFSGPNGEVYIKPAAFSAEETYSLLGSITQFHTSKAKRLEIHLNYTSPSYPPYQLLLSMEDLHTIIISRCASPHDFTHALDPNKSSSGVTVCPKLEELTIGHEGSLDADGIIQMAAARKSRGAILKSVRILSRSKFAQVDVLELKKHVLHVEC